MEKIIIRGYKSIKEAEISIASINILIGSNGAGKSNFLSFFEFLNNLYQAQLQEYISLKGGEDKMLHKGSKVTQQIYSKITSGLSTYSFELTKGDVSFVFTNETLSHDVLQNRFEPYIQLHEFEGLLFNHIIYFSNQIAPEDFF